MRNTKQIGNWILEAATNARSVQQMREREHYFFISKIENGVSKASFILFGSYADILKVWRACYGNH